MIVFATNHDEDTKVSFAFAREILGSDDIFFNLIGLKLQVWHK
jgi:hypothetical protein